MNQESESSESKRINNCGTCAHLGNKDGGHCYMFEEAPTVICMKHSIRQRVSLSELFTIRQKEMPGRFI